MVVNLFYAGTWCQAPQGTSNTYHLDCTKDIFISLQALNAMCLHSGYKDAHGNFKITKPGWIRIEMILEILEVSAHLGEERPSY